MKKFDEEFFRSDFDDSQMYVLRGDGLLYKFNYEDLLWEDVSGVEEFDLSWEPLTRDEAYKLILLYFLDNLFYSYNQRVEEKSLNKALIEEGVDHNISYYTLKSGSVALNIDNAHYINCFEDTFTIEDGIDENDILRELKKSEEVMRSILHPINPLYKLSLMKLYLDNNNNVFAFMDNELHSQYRISHVTGEMIPDLYEWAIDEDWRSSKDGLEEDSEELLKDFIENGVNKELTETTYDEVLKLIPDCDTKAINGAISDDFLVYLDEKIEENIIDEDNVQDLLFYKDNFGRIFAKDTEENEYSLTYDEMTCLDKGSINLDTMERIHTKYVWDYLCLYDERETQLKGGSDKIVYDLSWYVHNDSKVFGVYKDGSQYIIDKKGKIVPLENESYALSEKISMTDAVEYKSSIENMYILNLYVDGCERNLRDEGITIDDNMEFYCDFSDDASGVFLKDGKGQVFLCETEGMKKVDTDVSNFETIAAINVLALIRETQLIRSGEVS